MSDQVSGFLESISVFWAQLWAFLPAVLAALFVAGAGVMLARIARAFVERLLKLIHFNRLAEKSGLEAFFSAGEYPITSAKVIGAAVYWIIILMAVTAAADLLRLKIISDLFERVVLYLPNVIVAVVILIFGMVFSRIVNRFVFGALKSLHFDNALAVGKVCEYVVQVFVWFIALEQLQINTDLLLIAFALAFGALCLAAAIAFGLAGRDAASRLIDKALRKSGKD